MPNWPDWNEDRPIYRQLKDKIESLIIDGSIVEGEAVPSVRQVAAEERLNPLTVSKAYQLLVDDGMLETRRGLGMYVLPGAAENARNQARKEFLARQWPQTCKTAQRLGLKVSDLLAREPLFTEQPYNHPGES